MFISVKNMRRVVLLMKALEYDTSQRDLLTVLKPWQLVAMQVLWEHPEGTDTRTVYEEVNKRLRDEAYSRSSVVNFLEDMRGLGIHSSIDEVFKSRHHFVYHFRYDEEGFGGYIVARASSTQRSYASSALSAS